MIHNLILFIQNVTEVIFCNIKIINQFLVYSITYTVFIGMKNAIIPITITLWCATRNALLSVPTVRTNYSPEICIIIKIYKWIKRNTKSNSLI